MTHGLPSIVTLACALVVTACASGEMSDEHVVGVDIVDRTVEGISTSEVSYISGTYAGCVQRSGSWSVAITGSPNLPFDPLTVVQGDSACTLALTTITTLYDGALNVNTLLTPGPQVTLGAAWTTPKAFGNPLKFYANAMLSAPGGSAPVTIRLLLSSAPNPRSYTNTAGYAAISSSGAAADVAAPDYTISAASTTLAIGADALARVVSATGSLILTVGMQTGEQYLIYDGAIADTYPAIDAVWTNVTYAAAKVGMSTSIAASSLLGVSEALPRTKSLIVAHAANGVTSYQKFAITFAAPP